jgi:hypothetical protein
MLFVVIPHSGGSYEDFRFFSTFSSAEQAILLAAKGFERSRQNPDWCYMVGYDGIDELHPVFLYTITATLQLYREPYPSPSP